MQNTLLIFLTLCVLNQNYGKNPNADVHEALHLSSKTIKINNTSSKQSAPKFEGDGTFKLSEEINPYPYLRLRTVDIEASKNVSEENDPDSHFTVKMPLGEIIEKYKHRDRDALIDTKVSVAGRVHDIKRSGEHVVSYYVRSDGFEIQVVSASNTYKSKEEFEAVINRIRRGDIIGRVGHPDKDDHHHLVVVAKSIRLLSPCLHENSSHRNSGLENQESRFRKRYLDLILNDKTRHTLKSHSIHQAETPILNMVPGGATANPFVTHLDELNMDLFLRISSELYHKMLVVGGFNRIYEIGRQFRNEGLDSTHNPEFTSCEFYMAYADHNDLINMTETLLSGMVKSINGSCEEFEIDFTPPFARVSMMGALEQALNVTLPPADQLKTPEANAFISALCEQQEIEVSPSRTTSRLIDKLVGNFVQEKCVNPTFIMDYPEIMSPYAGAHKDVPGLTERVELYVSKKEVCNTYSELSDPAEQRRRWLQQARDRAAGDTEVPPAWPAYLAALQHAPPPQPAVGGGVDRIAMLLTDSHTIKEVILFPHTKPEDPSIEEDNLRPHFS